MSIFSPLISRFTSKKILAIYGSGGAGIELYEMVVTSKLYHKWKDVIFIDDVSELDYINGRKAFSFEKVF